MEFSAAKLRCPLTYNNNESCKHYEKISVCTILYRNSNKFTYNLTCCLSISLSPITGEKMSGSKRDLERLPFGFHKVDAVGQRADVHAVAALLHELAGG